MGGHKLGYINQFSTFLPDLRFKTSWVYDIKDTGWNGVECQGLGDPGLHVQDCNALRLGDDEF